MALILPILLVASKLLAGAAVGSVAAVILTISFADLVNKLRAHKVHARDLGELLGTRLANGQYRVVASVLSPRPLGVFPRRQRHKSIFTGKLDAQLQALLRRNKKIRVDL